MKRALCCLLLAGLSAFGQSTSTDQAAASLDSILVAARKPGASRAALSQQLADVILSLGQRDHQPSPGTVVAFTDELVGALLGKNLKWTAPRQWLLGPILEILSTSGANFTKASRLGDALKRLGVDASKTHRIITLFIKIGEEVRGPDDLQVGLK
jgi:hypothetical protein